MSVIRPRPPTDPIHYLPPAATVADDSTWRGMVAAAAGTRPAVLAATGDPAMAMLEPYGTTRSHACRRDSLLFGILEVARGMRESVDRVVVIGDAGDCAAVDLLLATCCHPFHGALPRADRGGRPRIVTLGPGDDDDTVQGVLDLLVATGSGDRLGDAWGVVLVGLMLTPSVRRCAELLVRGDWSHGGRADRATRLAIAVGHPRFISPDPDADWEMPAGDGRGDGSEGTPASVSGVFSAAGLLPAAVAGIDVVRLLEGAAAMHRRFREAPPDANPVLGCASVGPWLRRCGAGIMPPLRRRLDPRGSRWGGLCRWYDHLMPPLTADAAGIVTTFTTAVRVAQRRRSPFAGLAVTDRGGDRAAFDAIDMPRCDEHAIGQLLELLRLAAEVERRLG